MIKPCTCVNIGQDAMYGKGNRVHQHDSKNRLVCSVCRKTDGIKGKMCVRKHPQRAKEYREGMNYNSY